MIPLFKRILKVLIRREEQLFHCAFYLSTTVCNANACNLNLVWNLSNLKALT